MTKGNYTWVGFVDFPTTIKSFWKNLVRFTVTKNQKENILVDEIGTFKVLDIIFLNLYATTMWFTVDCVLYNFKLF